MVNCIKKWYYNSYLDSNFGLQRWRSTFMHKIDEILDQVKAARPATYTPDRAFCDDILK